MHFCKLWSPFVHFITVGVGSLPSKSWCWELWSYLREIAANYADMPWIILEDFNIIRKCLEKLGSETFDYGAMDELNIGL